MKFKCIKTERKRIFWREFKIQSCMIILASLLIFQMLEWFFDYENDKFDRYQVNQVSFIEMGIDFVANGGPFVMLFGNYQERHAFAKGQKIKGFGTMPYDTEKVMLNKGYNDEQIHKIGEMIGVAKYKPINTKRFKYYSESNPYNRDNKNKAY